MAMFSTAFTTASEVPASLTSSEIGALRAKLISFLDDLHSKRMRIRTDDYKSIAEHVKYSLTTLSNMDNMLAVAREDHQSPYGGYNTEKTLVYNADGSSRVIAARDLPSKGEGWERQFDQGLLQRPPCYVLPPQSITNIQRLRAIGRQS